jgi:hypothetical protein
VPASRIRCLALSIDKNCCPGSKASAFCWLGSKTPAALGNRLPAADKLQRLGLQRFQALQHQPTSRRGGAVLGQRGRALSWKDRWNVLFDEVVFSHYKTTVDFATQKKLIGKKLDAKELTGPKFVQAALKELKLEDYWKARGLGGSNCRLGVAFTIPPLP